MASLKRQLEIMRGKPPVCGSCLHPGFVESKALDGRPMFTCQRCFCVWTAGRDGGKYAGRGIKRRNH